MVEVTPVFIALNGSHTPVPTLITTSWRSYDTNGFDLHVRDNVVVNVPSSNNKAGDLARVLNVHKTKEN